MCHDSWAVMTYAKLAPDRAIIIKIRAKYHLQDFSYKLIVPSLMCPRPLANAKSTGRNSEIPEFSMRNITIPLSQLASGPDNGV